MTNAKKQRKKPIRALIVTAAVIVTLYAVVSSVTAGYFLNEFFDRGELSRFSSHLRYYDIARRYDRTAVSFSSGKNILNGYIYGEENDKGLLIFSHGLGSGAEDYTDLIKYFVDDGWRVLAYDNTGSCESGGRSTVGLVQSALDLDAALTYAENSASLSELPKVLVGHSWGGYAVTAALNFEHDVKAAVSFSGYSDSAEMPNEFASRLLSPPLALLESPFIYLYNAVAFGDKAGLNAVDGINRSSVPVMLVHGEEDETVSAAGAGIIAHRDMITNPNVQYELIPDRGHKDVFYSDRAADYADELNEEYKALYERYSGDIPEEELAAFYGGIDKSLSSELNGELFGKISAFLNDAVSSR